MTAGRSRIQGWHPESEFRRLLDRVKAILDHPRVERNMLMALQADVQRLVSEIKENNDLAKASAQALQVQGKQIDDLKTQIGALQAGQVLTAEDLAAIKTAADDLGQTNTELQDAVPKGTSADTTVQPAAGTSNPAPMDPATEATKSE